MYQLRFKAVVALESGEALRFGWVFNGKWFGTDRIVNYRQYGCMYIGILGNILTVISTDLLVSVSHFRFAAIHNLTSSERSRSNTELSPVAPVGVALWRSLADLREILRHLEPTFA